jgi:DNA recombination-dependent growth factor C
MPNGDVTKELWAEVPDRLRQHAFVEIEETADERSFGWVCFDDYLDSAWRTAPPEKAHYFAWSLRLDTRRIPPAVLKKHTELAIRQYKASIEDEDKKFVSKAKKKEIKENVVLRLRARTPPIPAVFEVVWDTRSQAVLFGSTNAKARALFEDLFTLTFELELEPQTPFYLASRLKGEDAVSRLENLEPTTFAAG